MDNQKPARALAPAVGSCGIHQRPRFPIGCPRSWSQLGLHAKPTGLLNTLGFCDSLLSFLDHAVEERFLRPQHRALALSADDPVRLLQLMDEWRPTSTAKWADGCPEKQPGAGH
jgi:hypothetical protein